MDDGANKIIGERPKNKERLDWSRIARYASAVLKNDAIRASGKVFGCNSKHITIGTVGGARLWEGERRGNLEPRTQRVQARERAVLGQQCSIGRRRKQFPKATQSEQVS